MAFLTKTGTFTLNTGAGSQSITGVGFQPKVVIFMSNAEDVSEINTHYCFGIGAADGTNQFLLHGNSENGVAPSDTSWIYRTTRCIGALDVGTANYDYYATFTSLDADGFTINVVWTPGFGLEVAYLCLGGDDLTDVEVGAFQKTLVLGNQSVTGLGFQPDAVIFIGHSNTYKAEIEGDANNNIGFMDDNGNQGCVATFSDNGVTPSNTARYQRTAKCYAFMWNGAIESEAEYVSMDEDGFTIDWTTNGGSAQWINYIALKGGAYRVGSMVSRTATGEFVERSANFQPSGGIFCSVCNTASSIVNDHLELSVGFADENLDSVAMGGTDEDAQNPTDADRWMYPDSIHRNYDFAQGLDGEVEIVEWRADGFALDQVDADTAQNEIVYLVFGDTPTPSEETVAGRFFRPSSSVQSKRLTIAVEDPLVYSRRSYRETLGDRIQAYSHTIEALGGYGNANFTFPCNQNYAEEWFEKGLGRHVKVYNPELSQIWEGIVNRVSLTIGPMTKTRGPLFNLTTHLAVVYSTITYPDDGTEPIVGERAITAWATDADAEARYGRFETLLSTGGVVDTDAQYIRDTYLEEHKGPESTTDIALPGGSAPLLSVECVGYLEFLRRDIYNEPSTTLVNLSTKIQTILGDEPNGLMSDDYTSIETNTIQQSQYEAENKRAWDIIKSMVVMGDVDSNRYLFGLYNGRKAYYEQAPSKIEYHMRISDPRLTVRTPMGSVIEPWNVRPGKWLFVSDFLTGRPIPTRQFRDDPRLIFVEAVTFTTPDSLSINGVKISTLAQKIAQLGLSGIGA